MKKNLFRMATLASAVALIAFASCQKEQQADKGEFTATIEQQQSKTTITFDESDPDPSNHYGYMLWESGDQVAIYGTNTETDGPTGPISFTAMPNSGDASRATLRRTRGEEDPVPGGADRYAIYPYSIAENHTTYGTVTLPATQTYSGNSLKAPMWASVNSDNTMTFKNLCGVLVISQLGDCTIKSIEITTVGTNSSTTTADYISGIFNINTNDPDNPVLTYSSSNPTGDDAQAANHKVTLDCNNNGNGVSSNNGATKFYIYLPAQAYTSGMTIVLTLSDNSQSSHKLNSSFTILRNQYYTITFPPVHSFSVAANRKVYLAPGNLQYIGSATTPYWKFADNQWSYFGTSQGNTNATTDRDAFAWAASGWDNGTNVYEPWHYLKSTTAGDYYLNNLNGTEADWAWHNAIQNGSTWDDPHTWRVLTADEWNYLLTQRNRAIYLKGPATVNGQKGSILVPDDFVDPKPSNITFAASGSHSSRLYSADDWTVMEKAGAIFLPLACFYNGNNWAIGNNYDVGEYWTSSITTSNAPITIYISSGSPSVYSTGRSTTWRCPIRPAKTVWGE